MFCSDKKGPLYRLCVAVKKRLLLFEYVGEYTMFKELTVPEAPLSLDWYGNSICVGFKRDYIMLNDDTGRSTELFSLESKSTPLCRHVQGEEFLLRMDTLGMVIRSSGEPSRANLAWSSSPTQFTFSFPYVLALHAKEITVHNLFDQQLIQTVAFSQGHCLVSGDGAIPGSTVSPSGGRVLAATPFKVLFLLPLPFDQQVEQLLQSKKVAEALELFERTADKDDPKLRSKRNKLNIDAGFAYLADGDFGDAFRLLNQSDVDPRELIALFPDLLPTHHSFSPTHALVIHETLDSIIERGMQLARTGKRQAAKRTKAEYMDEALECLIDFLQNNRSPYENTPVQEAIDTALLKLYVDGGHAKLYDLLQTENRCVVPDGVAYLSKLNKHNALANLYKNKRMASKALDIWQKLGTGALVEDGCDGIKETVEFLASCDDLELVWSFSSWVLAQAPEEGLKIFTSSTRENHLPPGQVLVHLGTVSESLAQAYLEYLVNVEKNGEEKYHTQLAGQYLDTVLALQPAPGEDGAEDGAEMVKAGSEAGLLGQVRAKLLAFLKESDHYHVPSILARLSKSTLFNECVVLYSKLGRDDEALKILVHKLADTEAAEQYCFDNWDRHEDSPPLLLTLLKVYLSHDDMTIEDSKQTSDSLRREAIGLVERHAKSMPPTKVLEILPNSFPIVAVQNYLRMVVQHSVHTHRDAQILTALSKTENLDVRCELMAAQRRSVVITRTRTCAQCRKPIGDSVFATYPSGKTVHFRCFKDKNADGTAKR